MFLAVAAVKTHTGSAGLSSKACKASSIFSSKAWMQGFFLFFLSEVLNEEHKMIARGIV